MVYGSQRQWFFFNVYFLCNFESAVHSAYDGLPCGRLLGTSVSSTAAGCLLLEPFLSSSYQSPIHTYLRINVWCS